MPFLSPNQQCRNTEGTEKDETAWSPKIVRASSRNDTSHRGYWIYVMVLLKKDAYQRIGSQVWYYQFTLSVFGVSSLVQDVRRPGESQGISSSPLTSVWSACWLVGRHRHLKLFTKVSQICTIFHNAAHRPTFPASWITFVTWGVEGGDEGAQ